ncbi:MAG: hypothetical protein H0X02_08325 [Nitrosomonas sp.]|nr:hypothetical protein [Nitrosomonas sp.]
MDEETFENEIYKATSAFARVLNNMDIKVPASQIDIIANNFAKRFTAALIKKNEAARDQG